jgi:Ethanolamine utilization protein EutJ (predicted chaperonin)
MAQERNRAATVVRQLSDRVEVDHNGQRLTAAMKGFPPGFTLNAGAKVILVDEEGGVVARPLVRAIKTTDAKAASVEMQAGTVRDESRAEAPSTGETVVWVVERGEAGAADQAIAVRRE